MSLLAYYMTLPTVLGFAPALLTSLPASSYRGMDAYEDILYVADYTGKKIVRYQLSTGQVLSSFPVGVSITSVTVIGGELYITADLANTTVRVFNLSTGAAIRTFGSVSYSGGVCQHNGLYYVSDFSAGVKVYDATGGFVETLFGSGTRNPTVYNSILYAPKVSSGTFRRRLSDGVNLSDGSATAYRHVWSSYGEFFSAISNSYVLYPEALDTPLHTFDAGETVRAVAAYGTKLYGLTDSGKLYHFNR